MIPNERNAHPQRRWSYVCSEKILKLIMVEKDGQVPQDLQDETSVYLSAELGVTLTCWVPLGALRLF